MKSSEKPDNKIKLVHIQLLPLMSGVQVMMMNLLHSLDKNKYEIYVISKPGGPLVNVVKGSGYSYIPVPSLRRNLSFLDPIAFFHLLMVFRRHKFDIVHTHSSKTGFLGRIAAKLSGVKRIIHTAHGFPFHCYQPIYARYLYRLLEKIAAIFCDMIVVVNNYEREEAIKSKLIPAKKLVTIYNGIAQRKQGFETPAFTGVSSFDIISRREEVKDSADTNKQLLSEIVLDRESFIIGSVSRFSKAKNIVNLTKVAVEVCKQNNNIIFVLVGDGELYYKCNKIVTDNNMNNRIIMPGWQDNINDWLDIMDLFLLYSLWEGLSISILEAMAAGLPVVASAIKGNNELIDNDNGILVAVNDHKKLVETLVSMPHRKDELKSWGENSLMKINKHFNHQDFVNGYRRLYGEDL